MWFTPAGRIFPNDEPARQEAQWGRHGSMVDWEPTHLAHLSLMSAGYGPYTREYVGRAEVEDMPFPLMAPPVAHQVAFRERLLTCAGLDPVASRQPPLEPPQVSGWG